MSRALLAAESQLERARSWSRLPANFHNPSGFPGAGTFTSHPDYPSLQSRLDLEPFGLYSPDWGSEMIVNASRRRFLQGATLRARVEVRWGSRPQQQVRLATYITQPNCGWHDTQPIRINMNPAGAALARGDTRDFTVTAYDQANRPMPQITFAWTVVVCTSDGTLQSQSRDGSQARFIHQITRPDGSIVFGPPGEVWVQATARYWGVERSERVVLNLL